VLVERVGAWDIPAVLCASEDLDRFCLLHAMAAETLATVPRPAGALDPRGFSLIMDMAGLGLGHLRSRLATVFSAVNNIDEQHYPDSVAHIFVVNAPLLFTALFAMVRPFLCEDTHAKVYCSSGVPPELPDILGPDCLPVELGGSCAGMFPYDLSAACSVHPKMPS